MVKGKGAWARIFRKFRAQNDNKQDISYFHTKALYDEAYEHLRQYEILHAKAEAMDLAYRKELAREEVG